MVPAKVRAHFWPGFKPTFTLRAAVASRRDTVAPARNRDSTEYPGLRGPNAGQRIVRDHWRRLTWTSQGTVSGLLSPITTLSSMKSVAEGWRRYTWLETSSITARSP
jgi:hypothetical protein